MVSGLAVDGDRLFVLTRSALLAVPAHGGGETTCAPGWSVPLPSGNVIGDVAASGGHAFVLDRAGTLWSVSSSWAGATCAPEWTATLPTRAAGLAVDQGSVIVTSGDTLSAFTVDGCGWRGAAARAPERLIGQTRTAPISAGSASR